jgi:uncharacterized membrane protein YfcA
MSQHRASATSLAGVVPISIVGALTYYFGSRQPQVDLRFALLVVVGGGAGAYLGARYLTRIPERKVQGAMAIILFGLGLKEVVVP